MKRAKNRYDVWGVQHNCLNYEECPLCYGCRAYDSSYIKCQHCAENMKKNVCNKKKHTPKALTMMIQRPVIVL